MVDLVDVGWKLLGLSAALFFAMLWLLDLYALLLAVQERELGWFMGALVGAFGLAGVTLLILGAVL